LPARAILDRLLQIEHAYGRERPYPGAARTLDLDLVLLGDAIEIAPDLYVPHPRFRERFFVLGPLAEIAPDLVDPVTGLKVWELLRKLLRDENR
jgi:2-amino-4-hydroxy-6-hydroxymethyldihydropteridine diphosphokinase